MFSLAKTTSSFMHFLSAPVASSLLGHQFVASFGTVAVPARGSGDVPPGHLHSDLSPVECNIGLGRRRDLTLRQDLCLYQQDGLKTSLSEILKVF
jgi:hypothetical protein